MSVDDKLMHAVSDWQRKYRIADDDPMMATLELVRIYLQYSREIDDGSDAAPPTFEDFRSTIELLDRRSKAFVQQATDLVGELRRFGNNVTRINRARFITHCVCAAFGAVAGVLIDRLL